MLLMSFNFVYFRLNFIWPSLLWPYNKLLVTICSSKRVLKHEDKYTNGRDRILGAFYTGAVFSSFMTNYSESYIEDLTVDSTLKHFMNSKKDFKGRMSKSSKSCKLTRKPKCRL